MGRRCGRYICALLLFLSSASARAHGAQRGTRHREGGRADRDSRAEDQFLPSSPYLRAHTRHRAPSRDVYDSENGRGRRRLDTLDYDDYPPHRSPPEQAWPQQQHVPPRSPPLALVDAERETHATLPAYEPVSAATEDQDGWSQSEQHALNRILFEEAANGRPTRDGVPLRIAMPAKGQAAGELDIPEGNAFPPDAGMLRAPVDTAFDAPRLEVAYRANDLHTDSLLERRARDHGYRYPRHSLQPRAALHRTALHDRDRDDGMRRDDDDDGYYYDDDDDDDDDDDEDDDDDDDYDRDDSADDDDDEDEDEERFRERRQSQSAPQEQQTSQPLSQSAAPGPSFVQIASDAMQGTQLTAERAKAFSANYRAHYHQEPLLPELPPPPVV